MPLPSTLDFQAIAGFSSGTDSAQFTVFSGFTITGGRANCTGAAGSRMLRQMPTNRSFGVVITTNVTLKAGLLVITGGRANPVSDFQAGAKFEVYTNDAGDKAMRLYLGFGTQTGQYSSADSEFYTSAPCPYPDNEFHTVVMGVRRNGWFVAIDGAIVLWLKAFTGPSATLSNQAAVGRGQSTDRYAGIVDLVGGAISVDSIFIQTTRNWGDPNGQDLNPNGLMIIFDDPFTAISGNWNPLFGPGTPAATTDTQDRLQSVYSPSATFQTNTAGGGVLTCTSIGAFQVLGQSWDLLELDTHGVMWEVITEVGTGGWQVGIALSGITIVYLYINNAGTALSMTYDAGGKTGFTTPWTTGAGSIAAGTSIGFRCRLARSSAGSLCPFASLDVVFEAYNYSTGAVVGGFTFGTLAANQKFNGVVMGSIGAANSTIGNLSVVRRSAMAGSSDPNYPIPIPSGQAPADINDPISATTSQRGHVNAGSPAGSDGFLGRPASLYRGLDRITSSTAGG